ncbi:MAG: flagellar protein FlgN [Desulfobacterales bacterium]|nr:flagellar protein FlgN [Desulfobacterales bacterium]
METPVDRIEKSFHRKILLYQDLLEVLKQERKNIMASDVDSLWQLSNSKQEIAAKIEEIRKEILNALSETAVDHDMDITSFRSSRVLSLLPGDAADRLRGVHVSLNIIKDEVQTMAGENRNFIEEYLKILDDLIGVIANAGQNQPTSDYGWQGPEKSKANLLLHKEV